MLEVILTFVVLSLFFIFLGFINKHKSLKVICLGIGMLELILMSWTVYAQEISISIVGLLQLNALMMLFLGFGIGFFSLYRLSTSIFLDKKSEENDLIKWQK